MPILEKKDEEIILLVKSGDKEAYEIIVDRYLDRMKRYARRFIYNRDDIDDLVQEVFLKAYMNIQRFDDKRKFSSWIYRIAHNEFVNAIKKKTYEKLFRVDFDTLFPHPAAKEDSSEFTDKRFTKEILDENLEKIDPKYREVLILYFFEDMDYKDITDVLSIPTSTVGVRISRGKAKLKELLKDKDL